MITNFNIFKVTEILFRDENKTKNLFNEISYISSGRA